MNLPACSTQPPINAERHAGKLQIPFLKSLLAKSRGINRGTRGINPRSTDCEADALTTTPSRWSRKGDSKSKLSSSSISSVAY